MTDLEWQILERVVEGNMTVERARYIVVSDGHLAEFDAALEIMLEGESDEDSN